MISPVTGSIISVISVVSVTAVSFRIRPDPYTPLFRQSRARQLHGVEPGSVAEYVEYVIHLAPDVKFKQLGLSGRAAWQHGRNVIVRDPTSVDGGTAISKSTIEGAERYYDDLG